MMTDTAGYSGTPLVRKLGIRSGMKVRLFNEPAHYWELFGDDPLRSTVEEVREESEAEADFQHVFANTKPTLETSLTAARAGMAQDGMIWASWPKKSAPLESEIGRAEVMAAGKQQGLVDVKVCAVDETWSALKFVIPVAKRR